MPLLIQNARVITSTDDYTADVYCAGEQITRIEKSIDATSVPDAEVIDARGKYLLPGFIDDQVDLVFANAGFGAQRGFRNESPEQWKSMVLTNVYGAAMKRSSRSGSSRRGAARGSGPSPMRCAT